MANIASTFVISSTLDASQLTGLTVSRTGNLGFEINVTVAPTTVDQLFPVGIDVSQIASIVLYADGALTLETNSGSAPDDTIVFAANAPLIWASNFPTIDGVSQNPFDADVTAFYLTNAGSATVTLRGFVNLLI